MMVAIGRDDAHRPKQTLRTGEREFYSLIQRPFQPAFILLLPQPHLVVCIMRKYGHKFEVLL